jgi:DNA invertase Pin-like site-specific DNA recombinase
MTDPKAGHRDPQRGARGETSQSAGAPGGERSEPTRGQGVPRAALYARVSTTGKGQDPELQLVELRRVAAQRGWTVVGEFVDLGISGAKDSRPALDKLLADAQAGKLNLVAVWKLDRLGRSLAHLLRLLDLLQGWGVSFVSLRDAGIDTTTAAGRLMLQLVGAFAEFERSLVQERIVAGIARAQAEGTHCGRPRKELDVRPALAMLDQGHGLKTTAKALQVSRATLRRRLEEAGEWPRSTGVQKPSGDRAL